MTSYPPFGAPTDQDFLPAVADESKGFIGERYDDETGLSYLNLVAILISGVSWAGQTPSRS